MAFRQNNFKILLYADYLFIWFPFLFQVTDILVSPKYDDDDTTEEEEDSDDTVYECPGLAATHRGGMEVRNPVRHVIDFFAIINAYQGSSMIAKIDN